MLDQTIAKLKFINNNNSSFIFMNFTLRQLQVLVAVARQESFTRAAQDLGMTQSAVSTSIRHLEAELGQSLFDRDTRNVHPTDSGRDLALRVGGLLDELRAVLDRARGDAERRRGLVRIAAVPTAITRLLPAACAECRARFPEIDLRIEEMAAEDVSAAVLDGRADLGIVNEALEQTPSLTRIDLGRDVFCLVCPRDHPLARKTRVRWRDLDGCDLVALAPRTGSRALIDDILATHGLKPKIVQEMSRPEAVAALVAAGMGVAVLPELAAPPKSEPNLIARPLADPTAYRRMVMIHADDRTPGAAASIVSEIVTRRANARHG